MSRIPFWLTICTFYLMAGVAMPVLAQTTATPDRISITIQEAAISTDEINYITIFDSPVGDELDKISNPVFGENEEVPVGNYKVLRLTASEISWHATWSVTNPSPCDGATFGENSGSVALEGNTLFYFKTPELGGNTLAWYRVNAPPSGYVGDADHPFLLASPVKVHKDAITTLNLIIGVPNTLSCDSISIYDRSDAGDVPPQHTLIGPGTRLKGLEGLYLDTDNSEIGVANSGHHSVAIYSRDDVINSPDGNVAPLRTIIGPDTKLNDPAGIGFYLDPQDPAGDEVVVANRGNDSVTVYDRMVSDNAEPLRTIVGTETGLSRPVGLFMDVVNDEIVVSNSGDHSVRIYSRTAFANAIPLRAIIGPSTGLSNHCGIYVDVVKDEILAANDNIDTVTIYRRTANGDIAPLRTIVGPSTGLSEPCGVYADNNEIVVANSGNDTVTIYRRDADGDVPPLRTIQGVSTGLNSPVGIAMDNNELWVAHRGQQVVMAHQPPIFPTATNMDAASSVFSGDYNVVFYGVDMTGVSGHGFLIPVLSAERGVANFDPATTPWPSFSFRLDTQMSRQILEPGCLIDTDIDVTKTGFYGVNNDGSFYAFTPDTGGSLQGVFTPDGSAFIGSTYGSSNPLLLVYGTRRTGFLTPYLTSDGKSFGAPAAYAFANYRNELFFTIPPSSTQMLRYPVSIGMAETEAVNFTASGDTNSVTVLNPMGKFEVPLSGGASFDEGGDSSDDQSYISNPGGLLESESMGLAGALTEDGSTMIFIRNTKMDDIGCPTDIGFGMGLRQSPAGTFTTSSLNGTYFVAAFGDRFDPDAQRNTYRLSALSITFDGAGGAEMAWIENAKGMISVDRDSLTYLVHPRTVPQKGDTSLFVDVVDIFFRSSKPYASALIGEQGKSLIFFRTLDFAESVAERGANLTRLLGLALFQHP